ncbi:MAG: preprotein translocase subunit SecE [Thermodesulfobacteriota bacterium]
MGLQQKRKDPNKKKKARESSSDHAEDKQPVKSAVSVGKSGVLSILKSASSDTSRKTAKPVKSQAESGVRRYLDISVQFLREVRVELKKVTWPSRKQTIGATTVVLLLVILVSIFLGIVDFGLSSLIRLVIG